MANANELSTGAKVLGYILGLGIPLFIAGVGAIYTADHARLERHAEDLGDELSALQYVVSDLAAKNAALEQSVRSHVEEKNAWIRRIEKNTDTISALSKDSSARPDPYTGTDAKADRAAFMGEVRRLDHKIDEVARCSCYRNGNGTH